MSHSEWVMIVTNQIWKSNSFGQRHRVGSVSLWKKFEYRATGIGCASAIVCVLISLYYNVILSWALYYLYNSFRGNCQIPSKIGFNRFSSGIAMVILSCWWEWNSNWGMFDNISNWIFLLSRNFGFCWMGWFWFC